MAKNVGSLVLVLVVMAILNGHVEAAGRGSQKTFFFDCPRWNDECFVWHNQVSCSLYYQFCVFSKGTNTAAGPNPHIGLDV
jgi:hypothetical protein